MVKTFSCKKLLKRWRSFALFAAFLFFSFLFFKATYVALPSKKNPLLFYSTETKDNLSLVYSRAIKNAKKSIHLTIYGLTDPKMIDLLSQKALEGVSVALYYDPSASENLEKLLCPQVSLFPFQGKGLMHKKILIIDDKRIFLGSANLTFSSLKMHSNSVAGIRDRSLAKKMQEGTFSSHIGKINGHSTEVYFLPNPPFLEVLYKTLNSAEKTIKVAMFTFTHPRLTDLLIQAKTRGVHVEVAIDAQSAKGASQKAIEKMERAGIKIIQNRGSALFHHKWALIDDKSFIIGSANWTKSAFSKNQDCFMIIKDISNKEIKWIKSVWKIILLESNH